MSYEQQLDGRQEKSTRLEKTHPVYLPKPEAKRQTPPIEEVVLGRETLYFDELIALSGLLAAYDVTLNLLESPPSGPNAPSVKQIKGRLKETVQRMALTLVEAQEKINNLRKEIDILLKDDTDDARVRADKLSNTIKAAEDNIARANRILHAEEPPKRATLAA